MKKGIALALFCSQLLFAEQENLLSYRIIENKAELPLLNPELAQRKFLKLELTNGVHVLLISDPGAEKSAAALAVQAGSWNDPKEYAGMAHFCEHMLFMGTKAYPKEFEYMHYVTDHAGMVNAYTACDRTVYMFSINHNGFEGALDRFAHFFIDPLFSTSCINRELHAVDQEHAKNVENDNWRQYMIFKETSNVDHPHSGFSTGNAATLGDIPQAALKNWYEKNYTANRMHLVVLSPLPLDEMLKLAVNDFSAVPAHVAVEPLLSDKISTSEQQGHITYIKPIRDLRRLSFQWELPSEYASLEGRKYAELLAYVLGDEGDTSLLALLKKEKIAENLNIEVEPLGQKSLFFNINIDLTAQGVEQTEKAMMLTFQMLARIKEAGIPDYLFQEMKNLSVLQYQYQTRMDAFSFITQYAHNMVDEDLATFPEATYIPTTYSKDVLKSFMQNFTAQNVIVNVVADPNLTGVFPQKKERWMDAEYSIREISQSTLLACSEAKSQPFLDLPSANPYIPSKLTLLCDVNETKLPLPKLIKESAGEKIYYSADQYYKTPESSFTFSLKSPLIDGSAKSAVLTELFLSSLREKLASSLYYAHVAGLNGFFVVQDLDLKIGVQGFSETAPRLAEEIFKTLSKVQPSRDELEIYRQKLVSQYQNTEKELPLYQALETLSNAITNIAPTSKEKALALQSISYETFIDFAQKFSKELYVQGMLYGNLTEAQASSLWNSLNVSLATKPYPVSEHRKKEVLVLSERQGPYMLMQTTERQGNSVVLTLQEGSFSFERKACQQVLARALQEGFFDTLRTKQQTAYIAKAWETETEKQLFQTFAVQSSTHQPNELLARFELFLEGFQRGFQDTISEERFETLRSMQVKTLEIAPENLQSMAARLHALAFQYDGDFLWINKRIDALKGLSYTDLESFTKQMLSRKNLRRLAVLVEGVTSSENEFRYEKISKENVKEIGVYITSEDKF